MDKKKIIGIIIGVIIVALLVFGFVVAYNNVQKSTSDTEIIYNSKSTLSGSDVVSITSGGSYDLSGKYVSVTINTSEDVELNLNGAEISNESGPAIYVQKAKSVSIVLNGKNTISSTSTEDLDGAIYCEESLKISGDGSLDIKTNYDGIVSKDELVISSGNITIETTSTDDNASAKGIKAKTLINISGGTFSITAADDGIHSNGNMTITDGEFTIKSYDDAIHADGMIEIKGGTFDIDAAEGIEATYVKIDDGKIKISASDDGINAGSKSTDYDVTVEINGGDITIEMGVGDTDGIDANGNLYINGGTINITGNSPFDYDGTAEHNGGTLIINGEETDSITNQFGGGMQGGEKGQMNGERPEGMPEDMPEMTDEMKEKFQKKMPGEMSEDMKKNMPGKMREEQQNQE